MLSERQIFYLKLCRSWSNAMVDLTDTTSLASANALINCGNYSEGLDALITYVLAHPSDQEQCYRLAVIAEQVGTRVQAIEAYDRCISLITDNVLVYLYAGYFFLSIGAKEKGLVILSLGQDLDARLTRFYLQNDSVDEQTKKRSYYADLALRNHFTQLHQISSVNSTVLQKSIWPQNHNKAFKYKQEQQQPHLFYIPEITAKPFWPAQELKGFSALESAFDVICKEFSMLEGLTENLGVPYLGEQYKSQGFEKLAGNSNWTALHLFQDGVENVVVTKHLPKTTKVLKKLPLYCLNENPYEVFFSVLKPQQHIAPHFGLSNHSLTVHLPIKVPGEGYITVADERRQWQEGEAIVFDDSFKHEAVNKSDHDRVVLIFSIWHPELDDTAQLELRNSFTAKEQWLEQRKTYLDSTT